MAAFLPNTPLAVAPRAPRRRTACAPRRPQPPRAALTPDHPDPARLHDPPPPEQPLATKDTADPDCPTCVGEGVISCSACNAFGFVRINADTDWRTCDVCVARGRIPCPDCQPADAFIPIEPLPPITPPSSKK